MIGGFYIVFSITRLGFIVPGQSAPGCSALAAVSGSQPVRSRSAIAGAGMPIPGTDCPGWRLPFLATSSSPSGVCVYVCVYVNASV
jgi:hypothetical protein